jgi:hypothetical protein
MVPNRTMSTESEWRHQAFVETKAIIEQVARGQKRRPHWARDQGSMIDRGLAAKDMCHHVIGSV